jgi:hypothetical protein
MAGIDARLEPHPDGTTWVFLSGTIDEDGDLEQIFASVKTRAVFQLEGVRRINSMGVRRWIPLITDFTQRWGASIEAISYPVVLQANCVANLFGRALIQSCMAPYFCPRCNANRVVLVARLDLQASGGAPPERRCERCQTVMEFDELESYFSFFREPRERR